MKIERFLLAMTLVFLLGIRDGYITLWKCGEQDPIRQFPYKAHYLPAADRVALEKGIFVETPQDLAQLLEDYLS